MLPETIGRWSIRSTATDTNKSLGMTQKSIGNVESREGLDVIWRNKGEGDMPLFRRSNSSEESVDKLFMLLSVISCNVPVYLRDLERLFLPRY